MARGEATFQEFVNLSAAAHGYVRPARSPLVSPNFEHRFAPIAEIQIFSQVAQ